MSIQPQDLGSKIVRQVRELCKDRTKINPFILNSIRLDAEKVIKDDPVTGYMALGCLSYLEEKTAEMVEFHEKSLRLAQHDYHVLTNYAISMNNTGRYDKAYQLARLALNSHGFDNIDTLKHACDYALAAGLINESLELSERLDLLKSPFQYKKDLEDLANLIQKNGFSQDDVKAYFSMVSQVLIDYDAYPMQIDCWEESNEHYVREIYISAEPDIAANMNESLSGLMASSSIPVKLFLKLCFVFTVYDSRHAVNLK